MRDDPIAQLHALLPLFNSSTANCSRLFSVILGRLRDIFPASDPTLFLYPIRGRRVQQRFFPPGAVKLSLQSKGFVPLRRDFVNGTPISRHHILYLPLPSTGQAEGFLSLRLVTPGQNVLSALGAVTQLLAGELRRHEYLETIAEQRLHADLDQILASATDIDELLSAAAQLLLRQRLGFCVIMRRLHDGTLLSPPQPYSMAAPAGVEAHCLRLEKNLALTVTSAATPRTRQLKPAPARRGENWTQFVLPLVRGNEVHGCLTLFSVTSPGSSSSPRRLLLARICGSLGEGIARLTLGFRLSALSADYTCRQEENRSLFRISRALHTIPRMNELIHFILAAATARDGGGFDRSMVFLANKNGDMLQGMLGLTRDAGELSLPPSLGLQAWENPLLGIDVQTLQRQNPFCRAVMKQRLPLEADTPVARAYLRNRIVLVSHPEREAPDAVTLAEELTLGPYACAPLTGGNRVLGVLVVDNALSQVEIPADRLRFLEIFTNLAGAALENSLLVRQLETANQNLQEVQGRLLHGERLALLGEMAATVAHELKTPLISIGGFAHRLARGVESTEQREYASIIVREVQRMETLLTGVLAFSKKHLLCFDRCDLNQILEKAVQLEEGALREAGIALNCRLSPDLPPIHGDADKLTQVFLNLLTNARQAMPNGGMLSIRSRSGLFVGKKCATIEVEDSGGGIPPQLIQHIFDPFFSTKEEGTGLGLAISAKIIEQHRGDIEVFNRGQGAVFIVYLPLD